MSAFQDVVERADPERLPPKVVPLTAASFVATWPMRPVGKDVAEVGLRTLSGAEIQLADTRAIAAAAACELADAQIDVYNRTIVHLMVAWGTTSPENVNEPYLDACEDNLPLALTDEAIRHLWDEQQRLHARLDPTQRKIEDAELNELCQRLATGGLETLRHNAATAARKELAYLLDELRDADTSDE